MALVVQAFLYVTYLMSNENPKSKTPKVSTFETRVSQVAAQNYVSAADSAARLATAAGQLIAKTNALTNGVPVKYGINYREFNNASVPPASDTAVYPFDKFAALVQSLGVNGSITIPARKMSAVTLESDGVSLVLDDGAAVEDWITAYESIALSEDAGAETVERMFVVK